MKSFATHNLINGTWVPKASTVATVSTKGGVSVSTTETGVIRITSDDWGKPQAPRPVQPIGFVAPTPQRVAVRTPDNVTVIRCFSTKREYLTAIRQAAGKILMMGATDPEVVAMVHRGRLGSKQDTLATLSELLSKYEGAIAR